MTEKTMFGKGISFKTEVTNGDCPMCQEHTVFVSLYHNVYRCITCGADTRQRVNGVIKFMPIGQTGMKDPPLMKIMKDDGTDQA